jgi:hypothetical protein
VEDVLSNKKLDRRGPLLVAAAGIAASLLAYGLFAISEPVIVVLGVTFTPAGVSTGCAEAAENAGWPVEPGHPA